MQALVTLEMNLQDLFERLSDSQQIRSRLKDVKTAVRVLAKALRCSSPETCPPTAYRIPTEQIFEIVDIYQTAEGKGNHTKRNTRNNLSALFRAAEERGLLTMQPGSESNHELKPQYDPRNRKARKGNALKKVRGYYLRYKDWPVKLQEAYEKLVHWATSPLIPGRPAKYRKRLSTMDSYRQGFEAHFGYLHRICKVSIDDLQWEFLIEPNKVRDFASWHVNVLHERVTVFIRNHLKYLCALLSQYSPDDHALKKIESIEAEIGEPAPFYDKVQAWVPLKDLEAIGKAVWPSQKPRGQQCTGRRFARRAAMSLILRLWVRRPYRQRNIREMELTQNLYRNPDGIWMVRFVGEQLKVSKKKGRTNHFELPFPEDLVPDLESYLKIWRPLLLKGLTAPPGNVFLTMVGTRFNTVSLNTAVSNCVYSYLEKRFHPHIVRTIWATEYIKETHDFYGAAVMLNDTLKTVIDKYAQLLDEGTSSKADNWIRRMTQPKLTIENSTDHDFRQLAETVYSVLSQDSDLKALFDEHPELHRKLILAMEKVSASAANHIPSPPLSTL